MPPALLTANRLVYESKVTLGGGPAPAAGSGNPLFGRGIAFRTEGSTLRLMVGSYNPQVILDYTVPASRSGVCTFTRILGSLPNVSLRRGLFWDDATQTLYSGNGLSYGSSEGRVVRTMSRGRIVNNALVAEGDWYVSGCSYKAMQGGVTAVPLWFQEAYDVGRLAGGFGGWYGIGGDGPASVGPTLAAFTPPETGTNATAVPVQRLQNYPWTSNGFLSTPRQRRPTNYKQYFENCVTDSIPPGFHLLNNPAIVPTDPTIAGIGYWNGGIDYIDGGGAWVDTPNFSGMVYLATLGVGCTWYGNNWDFINPCAGWTGTKATTNSTSRLHYWCITNPTDLGAVATGASPNSIQSVLTTVQFPGLPITITGSNSSYPFIGYPNERFSCSGMAWIPSIQRLAVGLYQSTAVAPAASGLTVFFYKVSEGGDPPVPGTPPVNDTFTNAITLVGANGTTNGTTVNSTIQSGEPPAIGSVWFTYTAGVNPVLFTLSQTGQTAQVYTGTSVGGLTLVTSGTTFTIPSGVTNYKIRVTPQVATNGFALAWDDIEPPPPDPPDPPPATLTISTAVLPLAEQTVLYSSPITATGGVQPYTFTQAGAPTGLTMSTSGVFSGTPEANGTFSVILTVTDSQPVSADRTLPLTVVPPPVVTTLALTSGQIATVYPGATLGVSGGTAPYTWVKVGGPTGLSLSSAGVYSGTPTESGSFTVAVAVTDGRGATATRDLPLTIAAAPDALVVTTASLPAGEISVVYAGATLAATGGVPPYTWAQTGGPSGLSLSGGGSYTGTPSQSGDFTVDVAVTDAQPVVTHRELLLQIAAAPLPPDPPEALPLVVTTASLPAGIVGVPYSLVITATGGTPPYLFSQNGIPVELHLSSSGLLSGTPVSASTQLVQIGVTDSADPQLNAGNEYTLTIAGPAPDPGAPAPGVPLLYLPRNKSRNVRRTTAQGDVVRWFSVEGTDYYQVYHGVTPNPGLVGTIVQGNPAYDGDYPGSSYQFPVARAASTTYYWRIVAVNGGGVTTSPTWKYTTR